MSDQRRLPRCCGSGDGDLAYGVDPAADGDTMVEAWRCSCGVVTITSVVVARNADPLSRPGNTAGGES